MVRPYENPFPTPPQSPKYPQGGREQTFAPVEVVLDSSDPTIQGTRNTPNFLMYPEIPDCVGVAVVSVTVPFSYNVIDGTNNQFIILKTNDTGLFVKNFYVCTIKPGTYNTVNIIPEIQSALATAVSTSGSIVDISSYFTVWIDSTNSLINFYAPQVGGVNLLFYVAFNFNIAATITDTETRTSINSSQYIIGFVNGNQQAVDAATTTLYDNSETAYVTGTYVTSSFAVNLTGEQYLYLHSSLAADVHGFVRNTTNSTDIVSHILVNNNYQGSIEYNNPFPVPIPFSKKSIGNKGINFYLTLGNRTVFKADGTTPTDYLDLKGQGFTLVLRFYKLLESNEDYTPQSNGDLYTRSRSQTSTGKQPNNKRPRIDTIVRGYR